MAVRDSILTLYDKGMPQRRIARTLGVNRETVARHIRWVHDGPPKPAIPPIGVEPGDGADVSIIVRRRGAFLVPQKVQIPRHGSPGDTQLGHEIRAIGWIPADGTILDHLNHAPDPVMTAFLVTLAFLMFQADFNGRVSVPPCVVTGEVLPVNFLLWLIRNSPSRWNRLGVEKGNRQVRLIN